MLTNNMLIKLIKIADRLDNQGKEKLADLVDQVVDHCGKYGMNAKDDLDELIKKMEIEPFEPKLEDEESSKTPYEIERDQEEQMKRRMTGIGPGDIVDLPDEKLTKEEIDAFMGEEE